ncbi:MAG: hypothetical protein CL916_00255 [Deltaproteobacteria bacterium]|nr:hypothetical protein [Deltaproteobacteria bacterium]
MKNAILFSFFLTGCTLGLDAKYHLPDEPDDDTTSQPSDEPSAQPANEPSSQPSSEPSAQPANEPSSQPSSSENPNLGECGDGIDNDNDGVTDCQDTDCTGAPVCVDNDNDGYSAVDDCNDYNDSINPGASEISDDGIDQDCDGQDETTNSNGGGGNGNPTTEDCSNGIDDDQNGMTDCDDYMCILEPVCMEDCSNGIDDNGNGMTDCDDYMCILDPACSGSSNGTDADSDGYDSIASGGNDCDDSDYYTYPGAGYLEINYNDCMTDADFDGYGDDNPLFGVVAGTDCDDTSYYTNPAAYDFMVDGIDQDCDGVDGPSQNTGVDADNDGYDSIASGGDDCDDNDSYTHPNAAYWDGPDCMTDYDQDNYGDENPNSGVTPGTDCNDSDYSINPGAYDYTTDGIDQDCDGVDYGSTSTGCSSTEIEDCNGNCAPTSWLGDNYCDSGNFTHMGNPIDFDCAQHNYDDGDCTPATTTCASYEIEDCNGNCVPTSYLGDGVCDNSTYYDLDCAQHNYDDGDCSSTTLPTECCFDVYMYDSSYDGWHGSYLHVYEDNIWASQHTLTTGGYGMETACVPYGSRFDLAFSDTANTLSGMYDSEITYDLYDSDYNLLISESDPPNGTRHTEYYVTCN